MRKPAPFRGRHTVHFFLALLSVVVALVVFLLNLWAYYDEGQVLTEIGYGSDYVATAMLFLTWFWGMFLAMSGTLPRRRILHLLVHGLLGSLTPLIYPLVIGLQMNTVSSQPISGAELALLFLPLPVLSLQFMSGWSVLSRTPWRRVMDVVEAMGMR
jgi:hypothetical protein